MPHQHIPPKGYSYQATESNTDNGQSGNDSLQNEPTPKKTGRKKKKSHSENRPLFCDTPIGRPICFDPFFPQRKIGK